MLKNNRKSENVSGLTVGCLKDAIAGLDDDCEIGLGGLTFYRIKKRGENLAQMEFNEQVYVNDLGRIVIDEML